MPAHAWKSHLVPSLYEQTDQKIGRALLIGQHFQKEKR
jgi:hypothetical protein